MAEPRTLPQLLERAALTGDHGVRVLDRHEHATFHSWAEIATAARRVARGLSATGIGHGERVALVYPTGREFLDAFFGALLAGAVPVPLYPPVRLGTLAGYHDRTAAMLRAAGAELVLAAPRLVGLLTGVLQGAAGWWEGTVRTLADLPEPRTAGLDKVSETDLALVQFSSGTTMAPKPVALSHRAVIAQIRLLNGRWPASEGGEDSGVSWLPLYHDMGLIGCLGPALERPGTLTLLPPEAFLARPALWLRAISRYRATISAAPNFAFALACARISDDELAGVDLRCWRVALCGAETIVPEVLCRFQERFAPYGLSATALTPVYGLAEAALAVTFAPIGAPFRSATFDREQLSLYGDAVVATAGSSLVSLGAPLPGFDVVIRDDRGSAVADCRVGRVFTRGPSLMEGYLGQSEATRAVLRDGWLDTGDCGFLRDGELYLTGRAKDLLILNGRNHAPEEVEHAVQGLPGARDGAAVAVSHLPDGACSERLLVLVEHAAGLGAAAIDQLLQGVGPEIAAATGLIVDEIVLLLPGTLPRTSSGKLRRGEALRRLLAGELGASMARSLQRGREPFAVRHSVG